MRPDSNRIRLVLELRRHGVTDTRVLSVIERTPRHRFVPAAFQDQAYDNLALPIGHGQTISQPVVVALMTEALALQPSMKVLESAPAPATRRRSSRRYVAASTPSSATGR